MPIEREDYDFFFRHFDGIEERLSVIGDRLTDVVKLLERIAVAVEKKQEPARARRLAIEKTDESGKKLVVGGEVHKLIAAYIDAFRGRYGAKARPDVGGRVQGLMRNMLKDHPAERLAAIVQAYLQMDDPWFKTKCHDFPTLYENVGKVQTALANGTARAGDVGYWSRVFGGENDQRKENQPVLESGSKVPRLLGVDRRTPE